MEEEKEEEYKSKFNMEHVTSETLTIFYLLLHIGTRLFFYIVYLFS